MSRKKMLEKLDVQFRGAIEEQTEFRLRNLEGRMARCERRGEINTDKQKDTPTTEGFDISSLDRGDVIQNRGSGLTYVVIANYGDRAVAVRTLTVTNPDEWELMKGCAK